MKKSQFTLLTKRKFLPLFLTQFLGAFNDNLYKNALVVLITYFIANKLSIQTNVLVTLTGCLMILPMFLFSAQAGCLADKYEKSALIRKIKILEIILMAIGVVGFVLQNIYLLMFIMFMLGVQSTLFGPLKYSILPSHLEKDELIAGNGLVEMGTFIAILTGNILGGILVMMPHGLVMISEGIFLVAMLGYISSCFIPKALPLSPNLVFSFNFVSETLGALKQLKTAKSLFACVLAISWFWLMGFVFLAQFPNFARDYLQGNEYVFILLLALFSIGIGIGSALCNWLLKGEITAKYIPWVGLGMTIFTADLYFATAGKTVSPDVVLLTLPEFIANGHCWRILFDVFIISLFGGIYAVPLYTILQYKAQAASRARMIGANNIMNSLFMTMGAVCIFILLKLNFSVPEIFLSMAVANLLVVALIIRWIKNSQTE